MYIRTPTLSDGILVLKLRFSRPQHTTYSKYIIRARITGGYTRLLISPRVVYT